MLITKLQQNRFWREWRETCETAGMTPANAWTPAQIENERHALITRAGFDSLTQVDPGQGYTRVLEELAALRNDLDGVLTAKQNKRRQIIWQIRQADTPYWQAIARSRFHTIDLSTLRDYQLEQLRNTLCARATTRARKQDHETADCPF